MKILLNLIATNKYLYFLDHICPTIEEHFFHGHEITALVHTNLEIPEKFQNSSRMKFIKNPIQHEPWPAPTLKRFEYFLSAQEELEKNDFCFYIDVDSLFIKDLPEDILQTKGMIGTIHPCLFNGPGTPDRNPNSKAYIPHGTNNRYFCGGFIGGSTEDFIRTSTIIRDNINDDLSRGVIALWHDESHINKYFFENPPTVVLDRPFAVAENLTSPEESSRILFMDKAIRGGHDFFRS
jgi:hypothetical protein